jgi:hypothetical protein
MKYPNDENGDVLRRMEAEGDDLSKPRDIDFTVVFPSEYSAKRFAEYFRERGHTVSVDLAHTVEDCPWNVIVVKNMTPCHDAISSFESDLEEMAITLGGRNDGWGCFAVTGDRIH